MKEPILLIMAAGMGSRYGGLKQMDPVGPGGEVILDYSIFDARRAGFKRVIFLIKHEIEEDFKRLVGSRIEKYMEVHYAFQQVDKIPAPYAVPEGRVKPWGTGHAVLCCKELIDAPFVVINADDYYGASAFQTAYDSLIHMQDDDKLRYMMVGYQLRNTLTDNGHVARGVCTVDEQGLLQAVNERTHIIKTCDGPMYTEDGEHYQRLPEDCLVSMNMWGFTPSLVEELEAGFPAFLEKAIRENPLKGEYFLPTVVSNLLAADRAVVRVLPSRDKWYGVTYQADKPVVMDALRRMAEDGLYPTPLWN
ncbi:MAG: NDP-sugar synthase [Aristaeellaceae bacterium]